LYGINKINKKIKRRKMKNPCGEYKGVQSNPIASKSTSGKLSQVFGKKGTSKKIITGK
jgi:hypothetical protein